MKRVTIAIASPSDVQPERDAIGKIFTSWNDRKNHAFLHPKMWEFAVPELGAHPQHILNQNIINNSDLLIAIFWSKVGTPTPNAASGTIDEIQEFIKKKGAARVMLYFCTSELPNNIDPAELTKLNEFKARMKTQGLFHQYSSVQEFERDLYPHLDTKVEQFLANELPLPKPDASNPKDENPNDVHPDKRLHTLIDFGTSLKSISQGFAARMEQFNLIDGCTKDKYYRLGAHVYSSAADCLDRFLIYSSSNISAQQYAILEKISLKLKRLASDIPDPKAPDFRKYWNDGSELAINLLVEVAHIEKIQKGNQGR